MTCEVVASVSGSGQICLTHGARTHYPSKDRDPACTLPVHRSAELDDAEKAKQAQEATAVNWVNRVLDHASYSMATLVHAPHYREVVELLLAAPKPWAAKAKAVRLDKHVKGCKHERAGLFCPWKL